MIEHIKEMTKDEHDYLEDKCETAAEQNSAEVFGYACPHCDRIIDAPVDICEKCDGEFGDCDGGCGNENCGNQHCQHCDHDIYYQICPNCNSPIPMCEQ